MKSNDLQSSGIIKLHKEMMLKWNEIVVEVVIVKFLADF